MVTVLSTGATIAPAMADPRDFCAERPGQTTPPCTLSPGTVMIETAAASWSVNSDAGVRMDTIQIGSSLLRAGVTSRLEAQIGWTPFITQRSADRAAGAINHVSGTGDVSLGLLYGLAGPNGPVAVQGFVTLPAGGSSTGAGDWGAGARLPVALPIGHGVQLSLTPEIDAAVNGSGSGRHLAYGGAAGIGLPLGPTVGLGVDVAAFRDQDPQGHTTTATAGASLAWQAGKATQIDFGGTAGLNANSTDLTLYLGIARRF